jgi:hypothetical protein
MAKYDEIMINNVGTIDGDEWVTGGSFSAHP